MISVKPTIFIYFNLFWQHVPVNHQAISTKLRKRRHAVHNSTETCTHIQADPPIHLKN